MTNKILKKEALNDLVWRYRISTPAIAKKSQAGQFIILRVTSDGERIPLTIADSNSEEGWIDIIFQPVGESTKALAQLPEGAEIVDIVGPLGKATFVKDFGRCVCIGGGVGVAPLYPIIRALKTAGNHVTSIIGARNRSLLILEPDIRKYSDQLLIATDDGSYGHHGFVSDLLKQALEKGERFDYAIVIGPPMMMKVVSGIAIAAGIKTYVSLNPIMIDGTGMCGGCRVQIKGKTYFGCVDGPEFEAEGIDWTSLMTRLGQYSLPRVMEAINHVCQFEQPSLVDVEEHLSDVKTNSQKLVRLREQSAKERIHNFEEVVLGYSESEAMQEASRCLQCKKPFCVEGCPAKVGIPDFIHLVAQGKFLEAGQKIQESHLFPSICGRVCPQENQCEKQCVLGRKGNPIAIGALERFVGDWMDTHHKVFSDTSRSRKNKKVAVVGSGPSGLTVASELMKAGIDVTLFEALHEVGGVLRYGIPDFRLPKEIVKNTIQMLKQCGVTIVSNFIVGKTATIDELLQKEGFDAVFIGSGAGFPIFLNIPGEHYAGVYSANEYLTRVNLMRAHEVGAKTPILKGERVIVVGGGNVAMDAARTAVRLGAKQVQLVYRRSEVEMPARKEEVRHAKEEGIQFCFLTNPIEIVANEKGIVKTVRCVKMQLTEQDEHGRSQVEPIKGSEFEMPCDAVVIAIGNRPNPLIQNTTSDLEINKTGTISVNPEDGRTSKPRVYAGGDVASGAATVILAIEAGKKASQSIIKDLLIT